MDISSIIASNNTSQPAKRPGNRNELQAAINNLLVGGNKKTSPADDVASLSLAEKLQAGAQSLKRVSVSLARTSSLTQVANQGLGKIESSLETLKTLAKQAENPQLSAEKRAQISAQFKEAAAEINKAVDTATFDGKRLLGGELTGKNALSLKGALTAEAGQTEGVALSIEDVSLSRLFKGKEPDLSSPEGARDALALASGALKQVNDIRTQVSEFQQSINFAAAQIDSAISNQTAAQSLLPDLDLVPTQENGFFSLATLQQNTSDALYKSQGVSSSLLKLVG